MIHSKLHFNNKGFIKIDLGISKGRKRLIKGNIKDQDWKRQKRKVIKKMILLAAIGSNNSNICSSPLKNCLNRGRDFKKLL